MSPGSNGAPNPRKLRDAYPSPQRDTPESTPARFLGASGIYAGRATLVPVYVIQSGKGPCKIGRAQDVRQRLSDLQTSTHEQLRLVAAYEGGVAEETALHRQFAALRLNGEWFDLTPEAALRDIKLKPFEAPPKQARASGYVPVTKWRPYLIELMDDAGLEPVGARRIGPGYHDAELTRMTNAFSEKRGDHVIGVDLITWPTADRRLRIARSFVRTTTEPRSDEPLDKGWQPPFRERSPAELAAMEAHLDTFRSKPRKGRSA
jgi:hypothetical protein